MGDETGGGTPTPAGDGEQAASPREEPTTDGEGGDGSREALLEPSLDARVLPRFETPDVTEHPSGGSAAVTDAAGEPATDGETTPDDRPAVERALPRFEPETEFASAAVPDATDRSLPVFEPAPRHPAERPPRSRVPDEAIPQFERDRDGAAVGTLLGEAAKGTLQPEPAESVERPAERGEYEPSWGIEGPEYDEEMPLTEHIEEMIKRLAVVIVVAGSVSLVTFPFADEIINFLWYSILPAGEEATIPRLYGPLDLVLTRIKVASLVGLIVALPVVVYETYAFMRPGLYPHERRYYLAAVPMSLVLAVIGVTFAYFIVLPAIFTYFLFYSEDAGTIAFGLSQTFDLILILMAYLAVVFQIPLFIMLAIMMGLVTRRWLAEKRLYFWGAFLGLAFISSPDPTGMAPIIIALTMVGLFEGTLALLKWVDRGKRMRRRG